MHKLFLFLPLALWAADTSTSIHGTVLDPSGRPIEAAHIRCGDQTTFTNLDGRFVLNGPDACDATIDKQGFQTSQPKLTAGAEAHVTLTIQGPVDDVVVTATRAQATPEQAAVAANTIGARQIEARDYASIPDLLREIPGVAIVTSGRPGNVTSIFTRGASSTSTLVLVDGVPVNDPGGQVNLAHLSSIGVERVEMVRGPESALFGAEASAGVVQIFTARGDPENAVPHGFVSYERGNYQTDRWLAGISGGFAKRFDYSLNASQYHTPGEFQNDFYRNDTGSANVGYRISEATQLRGIFRIYDAHLGSPGQVAYNAIDYASNEESRDSTVALRLDDSRGARYFQTFSFSYHRLHDLYNDNEPYSSQNLAALVRDSGSNTYFVSLLNPAALPPTSQIPSGDRIATATSYFGPYGSLNITQRYLAGYQGTLAQNNGALVFGYDYQHQSGLVSGTDVDRDHDGFFINEQYRFGRRIYVSGGARVEYSTAFGTEFLPRGGISFQLYNGGFLRLSAGRGVVEPSLYENYVQSPYAKGNPALKPEKTDSYEAAFVQQLFGGRFRGEIAAFRNNFHDLITYVYPSWQNIEKSWGRGIEFSTETRLMRNVLLSANYTLLYTRVVTSASPNSPTTGIGQQLLRRPQNSGSIFVSATPRKWNFVIGARIVGERHDSDYNFGITRNPGYENVFFSGSYTLSRHLTPVLRIDNLLNERYEEVLGYTALSRSIIGGLRVSW